MKTNKLFLLLPALLLALPGCAGASTSELLKKANGASATGLTPSQILSLMKDGYGVQGNYTETLIYPEGYEFLDTSYSASFRRDYGHIVEEGKSVPAVREYIGSRTEVYFRGENNGAYQEVLLPDNTVGTVAYGSLGMDILYADVFRNPFNYIEASDIGEDLSLDSQKASFLLETWAGIDRHVLSASFVLDGDEIIGMTFQIADKQMGIATDSGFANIVSTMDVVVEIDRNIPEFDHLSPSTRENADLKTALEGFGSNFTASFSSNGLEKESRLFVTEDAVYFQADSRSKGPKNDDRLYHTGAGGIYTVYRMENGLPVQEGINRVSPVDQYLNGLFTISPALFEEDREGLYLLIDEATAYGASAMIPSTFGMGSGNGVSGYVTLSDGKVQEAVGVIAGANNVTFRDSFSDYGTTSLPAWIDLDIL